MYLSTSLPILIDDVRYRTDSRPIRDAVGIPANAQEVPTFEKGYLRQCLLCAASDVDRRSLCIHLLYTRLCRDRANRPEELLHGGFILTGFQQRQQGFNAKGHFVVSFR